MASPPYYLHPKSVQDQTDYLAGKVLDHLGVAHTLYRPWGGTPHNTGLAPNTGALPSPSSRSSCC